MILVCLPNTQMHPCRCKHELRTLRRVSGLALRESALVTLHSHKAPQSDGATETRRRYCGRKGERSSATALTRLRSGNIISSGTMHRVIIALLLAASQAAVIRPGDKYTLDLSKDSCTTIIVGKDLCGNQPVRRVHSRRCAGSVER